MMKKFIFYPFSTIIVLFLSQLNAQEIHWNNKPEKGFVFQINNNEAEKLLSKRTLDTIFNGLLHTLVDSFDIKKGWIKRPEKGHFILATIEENKLKCEYTSVFPYQVFLFQEYDALSLQVVDLNGNVREDAIVKLKRKRLRIDPESKTYRIESVWFHGDNRTATVELEGFRSIFNIDKHEVPTWHRDYWGGTGPDFYSYMITDKNKYKPNEKVRFKSYALSSTKWPLRKNLEVWLLGYRKSIKMGIAEPHRPGSYTSEFHLHDSLKLVLDKPYSIQLREKSGRVVAECSFKYEDYELFGNKLNVDLKYQQHFCPDTNIITITATDVNGLMLKDARANILVRTQSIQTSYQPLAILPDTLLFFKMDLDPAEPTKILIPSDIFEKTNTNYKVIVSVVNSENKRMERQLTATHYFSKYELGTKFSNDSICFSILEKGGPMQGVKTELKYNANGEVKIISLPYKEKINPANQFFYLKNEFLTQQISQSHLLPELVLTGGIQKDSFNINLQNPQNIELSWFVYQGNNLLQKGFGKEMEYKSLIEDRTRTYYVELFYSFGGVDHKVRRNYEFKEEHLNVLLDIPGRIYPGQEVDACITVTNQKGDPVRGADLTALAVTSKLDYYLPDLPYYGSSSSPRPKSTHFTKDKIDKRHAVLDLNYKKWKRIALIDTMKYYQFIYPAPGKFIYPVDIEDSTQFAPYIMQRGRANEIYVIEVDRKPVYYSWTQQPKGYSFYVSPNEKHEISLRLFDRVIVLDSLSFESGKKKILSIDLDKLPPKTKQYKLDKNFTGTERNRHLSYIAAFEGNGNYSYLESEKGFIPVSGKNVYWNNTIITGPITPERKTYFKVNGLNTTYKHTGNYRYKFEENIVYKLNQPGLIPEYLSDRSYDPLKNINDKVVTKSAFLESLKPIPSEFKWNTRTIYLYDKSSKVWLLLPNDDSLSGIKAVFFESCDSKHIFCPWYVNYDSDLSEFRILPSGCNKAVVLYNDGRYLKVDSIPLKNNVNVVINMKEQNFHAKDTLSDYWYFKLENSPFETEKPFYEYKNYNSIITQNLNTVGNIHGVVYDDEFGPLPGVNIIVAGTNYGTITDIDGQFSLDVKDYNVTLNVSFIGYETETIEAEIGTELSVHLVPDLMELDEVVVVGYGTTRKADLTGAVSSVQSAEIAQPDDEEDSGSQDDEGKIIKDAEQRLYKELLTLNSIRTNFSDVGFWEPKLFTNKHGKSEFTVKFPDDITQWDAVVYAMNSSLQTGTAREYIKSYKPLMAELHIPQFLTVGDSAFFVGKILNYTQDSTIKGQAEWSGAGTDFKKEVDFEQIHTDKLPVFVTDDDSITSRYAFTRDDGYLDGEERTIPVVEQGIIRADGTLSILDNGDTKTIKANKEESITVEVFDNQIDVYEGAVWNLINYRHACNEQLASKLIGLLNYRLIKQYNGEKFHYDKHVKKIIKKLIKNQNQEFLWSWWDVSSNTSYWMSAHILRALKYAQEAGYEVELDVQNITRKATYKFDFLNNYSIYDIDLIHALATWGVEMNYAKYLPELDTLVKKEEEKNQYYSHYWGYYRNRSYLKEKLILLEIRQLTNTNYLSDSLIKYKKEGTLGDVFFWDDKPSDFWYNNKLAANIVAYRIVKNDSLLEDLKTPMEMFFLNSRRFENWNTYQSANILQSVLPNLLAKGASGDYSASISITGKESRTITKFPYKVELAPNEVLHIKKEAGLPLFFMEYKKERVTEAKTGVEGFEIETYFYNNITELKAGKPVSLFVDVNVKKETRFQHVMIEVPIPGACSYADKRQSYYGVEIYREYFKERTNIYCENLKPGHYRFEIKLLPRFTGKYILNPAQVSLMYIPVVNANTDMKKVEVVEEE